MKRLIVVPVAALALVLAGGAAAKGPSAATIAGPGLVFPVTIDGIAEGDTSTPLGLLVVDGGFFPEVFGQSPSPLLRQPPSELGPRYTVTYTVPGPAVSTLEQELYPYAAAGPATHMQAGQRFWETQRTLGGWYRGTPRLKSMLVRAGLPATAAPSQPRLQVGRNVFVG
ncbi:MAG: hypothetical protein ACJ74C_01080 [Gaiellaceae bacterium]